MTKISAIESAVNQVRETGVTFFILRRGYTYRVHVGHNTVPPGWKISEMIATGNVHNFATNEFIEKKV